MPTQLPQAIVPLVRLSTSGVQNIGLEWEVGLATWLLGHSSPALCQMDPGATGGVSQLGGFLVTGDTVDVNP